MPSGLTLQVVSDLTPVRDVDAISVLVRGDGGYRRLEQVTLTAATSLGRPRRILELPALAPGRYEVEVTLLSHETAVVTRDLRVLVDGPTVRTLLMTRDCGGVTCGASEACSGGRCVPRECAEEIVASCGTPTCTTDLDCTGRSSTCAPLRCTASGVCEALPDDDACTPSAPVCDPALGCLAVTSPGPLVLTGRVRVGSLGLLIDATTLDATRVWARVSPVPLSSPGLPDIQGPGQCAALGPGLHCTPAVTIEPSTTYYVYAIAIRETASGDTISNVFDAMVTTLAETSVLEFTSMGLATQAALFLPDAARWDESGATHPTIMFLHGGGEMDAADASAILTGDGLLRSLLVDRARAASFPFIVIAPHCRRAVRACDGWPDELPIDTLDAAVAAGLPIDSRRVYVTGLSFGGEGTFRTIANHPTRFAAALPIASTTWLPMPATICDAAGTPVWAFHGAHDTFWAPASSMAYMNALDACAGAPAARQLTLLECRSPPTDHCGWNEVYGDVTGDTFEGSSSAFAWLLSHSLP